MPATTHQFPKARARAVNPAARMAAISLSILPLAAITFAALDSAIAFAISHLLKSAGAGH